MRLRQTGKTLITGITGMVGSHMADHLLDVAITEVVGLKRWRSPMDNIRHLGGKVRLVHGDLTDLSSMVNVMRQVKPDIIYHFAAQSYVPDSFTMPAQTLITNGLGTLNLLEAVRIAGIDPFIVVASSSEVYGQVTEKDVPITEECPLRPVSPYGVSKVTEDMLAYQYFKAYGMDIIRTRLFTHTGPRRGSLFAASNFARQIALIEAGKQEPYLHVGNLDSVRTWLDVRDAVRAYWCLVTLPAGEVYNIGGDTTLTIRQVVDSLHLSRAGIKVVVDAERLRPADVTLQIPDTSKFRKATGWAPQIPFEKTMADLLNYWRAQVRSL